MTWVVSQISLPIRILLIGAAVFLVAWFTVLSRSPVTAADRDHDHVAPASRPRRRQAPRQGRRRRPRAPRRRPPLDDRPRSDDRHGPGHAAPPPSRRPSRSPPTSSRSCPRASPARSRRARSLVLGVLRRRRAKLAPDGRRRPLRPQRPRARPTATTATSSSSTSASRKLSTYGALVNDLDVKQSPTVVVIDRNLKGTRRSTGYVDRIRSTRRSPTRVATARPG